MLVIYFNKFFKVAVRDPEFYSGWLFWNLHEKLSHKPKIENFTLDKVLDVNFENPIHLSIKIASVELSRKLERKRKWAKSSTFLFTAWHCNLIDKLFGFSKSTSKTWPGSEIFDFRWGIIFNKGFKIVFFWKMQVSELLP